MKFSKKVKIIALALCISMMSSTLVLAKDKKEYKTVKFKAVYMAYDPHPKDGEFPE